jgi:hypothetical protein
MPAHSTVKSPQRKIINVTYSANYFFDNDLANYSDSISSTPYATGNTKLCPSTTQAATNCPLNLPVRKVASIAK